MKLILIIESMYLKGGGAEKTISIMANYWASKGEDITILAFDRDKNQQSFFKLNSNVKLKIIGNGKEVIPFLHKLLPGKFLNRIFAVKKILNSEQPDAVISFMDITNIFSIFASKLSNIPIIISDRNNPVKNKIRIYWKWLRQIAYPMADKLIVLTKEQIQCYPQNIKNISGTIPCIIEPPVFEKPIMQFENPFILSVGRLRKQKGHDLLITAFKKITNKYPQWKLIIIGEGVRRKNLEKQIQELKLQDKIFLPGCVNNPQNIIKQADFFVFPSRWEGLGNALLEAMSCGIPVIATDCDFGPKSYVRNNIDGLIIKSEDVNALANALEMLINDEKLRETYGKNAKDILNRFNLGKIMPLWNNMIQKVIKSKQK